MTSNMTGEEFIVAAGKFAATYSDPASCRTAISRAFHSAKSFLDDIGIKPPAASHCRDDADREDWLRLLDQVATRSNWRVFAWVLMSNHFHLFLRTPSQICRLGCTTKS